MNSPKNEAILQTIRALLLGQLVSFVLAIMSFTASLIATLGVDAPLTLSFFSYSALAIIYGGVLLYRRQKLLVPWYYYILLGFLDVQGNYLTNKAYEFSSITSVTLLDCCTIAWVIILTWIILGTRYSRWQFFGATICIIGLSVVLISDAKVGGGGGSNPILGDLLVISATFFFAFSNVGEEFCVKKKDFVEVIAMIGVFGMLVSVIQISIFERKSFESIKWSVETISAFGGYAFASFMFYSFVPLLLKMSGSTMLNLSILTSDMWAVVIRIFFYRQKVDWLYYLSFAIVVIGLVIYSKTEKDVSPVTLPNREEEDANSQREPLNAENMNYSKEDL